MPIILRITTSRNFRSTYVKFFQRPLIFAFITKGFVVNQKILIDLPINEDYEQFLVLRGGCQRKNIIYTNIIIHVRYISVIKLNKTRSMYVICELLKVILSRDFKITGYIFTRTKLQLEISRKKTKHEI